MRPALLLVLLAAAASACASDDPPGGPPPLDPEAMKQLEADAAVEFAKAEALRDEGELDDATDAFHDLVEAYPGSLLAPEAQFQAAECAFRAKRWYAAGELFGQYAEERPLNPHVEVVERRLYEIGDRLIEGGKRGLFGTGFFTTSEEGVNVLRKLATLMPTGSYADDALMRIGRYYAEERDYVGAESTLDELLKGYPGSEWRLEARFILAWAFREDNRGPEYDGEKLRRARAHFSEFVHLANSDPDRAVENRTKIDAAREEIAAIDADLARKALIRARFYRRSGRPDAALVVLREGARQWGNTEPGKECAAGAEELAAELGVPSAEAPSAAAPEAAE